MTITKSKECFLIFFLYSLFTVDHREGEIKTLGLYFPNKLYYDRMSDKNLKNYRYDNPDLQDLKLKKVASKVNFDEDDDMEIWLLQVCID